MQKRELTCIGCPMGCGLTATLNDDGGFISVEGYTCPVGKRYGEEEVTRPMRMVTGLMRVEGCTRPLSVKTREPIEKRRIAECLSALAAHSVKPPVHIGDVVLKDVCGTDIVATSNM